LEEPTTTIDHTELEKVRLYFLEIDLKNQNIIELHERIIFSGDVKISLVYHNIQDTVYSKYLYKNE
jgi:hypothetical protein